MTTSSGVTRPPKTALTATPPTPSPDAEPGPALPNASRPGNFPPALPSPAGEGTARQEARCQRRCSVNVVAVSPSRPPPSPPHPPGPTPGHCYASLPAEPGQCPYPCRRHAPEAAAEHPQREAAYPPLPSGQAPTFRGGRGRGLQRQGPRPPPQSPGGGGEEGKGGKGRWGGKVGSPRPRGAERGSRESGGTRPLPDVEPAAAAASPLLFLRRQNGGAARGRPSPTPARPALPPASLLARPAPPRADWATASAAVARGAGAGGGAPGPGSARPLRACSYPLRGPACLRTPSTEATGRWGWSVCAVESRLGSGTAGRNSPSDAPGRRLSEEDAGHGLHLCEVKASAWAGPALSPSFEPPPRCPPPGGGGPVGWVSSSCALNDLWGYTSGTCRPQQPYMGPSLTLPQCLLENGFSLSVCNADVLLGWTWLGPGCRGRGRASVASLKQKQLVGTVCLSSPVNSAFL